MNHHRCRTKRTSETDILKYGYIRIRDSGLWANWHHRCEKMDIEVEKHCVICTLQRGWQKQRCGIEMKEYEYWISRDKVCILQQPLISLSHRGGGLINNYPTRIIWHGITEAVTFYCLEECNWDWSKKSDAHMVLKKMIMVRCGIM